MNKLVAYDPWDAYFNNLVENRLTQTQKDLDKVFKDWELRTKEVFQKFGHTPLGPQMVQAVTKDTMAAVSAVAAASRDGFTELGIMPTEHPHQEDTHFCVSCNGPCNFPHRPLYNGDGINPTQPVPVSPPILSQVVGAGGPYRPIPQAPTPPQLVEVDNETPAQKRVILFSMVALAVTAIGTAAAVLSGVFHF